MYLKVNKQNIMAINVNPTGLFPLAQGGSETPYTFLADNVGISNTGAGIYLPLVDLEQYGNTNNFNEGSSDGDWRYILYSILKLSHDRFSDPNEETPLGMNILEGSYVNDSDGGVKKTFTVRFNFDPTLLEKTLTDGDGV